MRLLLIALCVAAVAAPAASAKGRISVGVSDSTPRVGQQFTVSVRTGWVVPRNDWLRLIAVAPGKDWYSVVGTVTGDSSLTHANVPHDGFEAQAGESRVAELASRRATAPAWTLAAGRPQRDASRVHGPTADGVDALGAGSPLAIRCVS